MPPSRRLVGMKLKAIALALFIAGAGASYAVAGDGHGKGKSDSTSTSTSTSTESHGKSKSNECRPNVAFVFNGTFVAAGSDGTSFSMKVIHANHHAAKLGSPATIQTDASTRILRDGKGAKVAELTANDRLNVQARGCKTVPAGTTQTMVAKRVVAHDPASSGGTETTETTTTTSNG